MLIRAQIYFISPSKSWKRCSSLYLIALFCLSSQRDQNKSGWENTFCFHFFQGSASCGTPYTYSVTQVHMELPFLGSAGPVQGHMIWSQRNRFFCYHQGFAILGQALLHGSASPFTNPLCFKEFTTETPPKSPTFILGCLFPFFMMWVLSISLGAESTWNSVIRC